MCARLKNPQAARAELKPITDFHKPFDKVGVDVLELTRTNSGNKYLIVFTDYLTKWIDAIPIRNMRADIIAKIFVEKISRHSAPSELLSDQGKNFLSNLVKEVCDLLKTKNYKRLPITEKANRTLCQMLAPYESK